MLHFLYRSGSHEKMGDMTDGRGWKGVVNLGYVLKAQCLLLLDLECLFLDLH